MKTWVFISFMIFVVSSALATPSLNSKCGYALVTPSNGSGVFFDETCSVGYVMPPKLGRPQVNGLARTTNLQFCPAVKDASKIASRTFKVMDVISEKMEQMIKEYEPLSESVQRLKMDLVKARIKMEGDKKSFANAEIELDRLSGAIGAAKANYHNCTNLSSDENTSCLDQKLEWDESKREYKEFFLSEYRNKQKVSDDSTSEYKMAQARFDMDKNRYVDAIAPMIDLQHRMTELNASVMSLYAEYTKLEGATGQIVWSIGWDRILEDYRRLNPQLSIDWQRLPLKSSELVSTIKDPVHSLETGITALKSATIPGARSSGPSGMGSGEKVDGLQTKPSESGQAAIPFSDSVAGQIVLTLAGACPYYDGIENRTQIDSEELAKNITANLIYTYDVATRRGYSAHYNLSNLLTKMEDKSKKGGFFSTSFAHSIIEDGESSDWFSISFNANSSDYQYSPTEQSDITKTVKQELMDKALSKFAILNAGSATPPAVPNFIESGASVGGSELRKCWFWYCQVGSVIFGVADSIWGSSSAVVNFHRNNNVWVGERVNGLHFVSRSGSLTFDLE